MPETEPVTEAHDGSQEDRLERVESKVDRLAGLVEKILPTHDEAEAHTEKHLDRGSSVAEQVQAELDKRDRLAAEQQAADAEKADAESFRERLARLEEKPPAPPRLRRTALLGWGDGRE